MKKSVLTIDVGNSNVVFGLFRGKTLIKESRLPTGPLKLPSIHEKTEKIVVCSVVPALDKKLKTSLQRQFKCPVHFVTAKNIPGIKVRLKNKNEIGADRVVNALAAYKLYGGPAIIVDFGTATTFDVISAKGEYLGGAIAPGILLARDALYEQTAKLPRVEIKAPRKVIGKNTLEAMQSGLVYGYVAMVEGMILRIKGKSPWPGRQKAKVKTKVIATGGLAKLICKHMKIVDRIDMELTLKGLKIAGELIDE